VRGPLALAAVAVAALVASPAAAGPPEIQCTDFAGYYPPLEEAWAGLPPEVRAVVIEACGWDR
jgi:hypothetical protein